MKEYDMAEVQKQWYDRNGWPLDLNAVYAINEFKGDASDMAEVQKWYLDGGPGSGNWGHKGRPGIRGGSGAGGGVQYRYNTLQNNVYTSEAKAWAENKKNGGQGANQSHVENKSKHIKDAMNSGDSKTIKKALGESKEGDQLTIVTTSGKHIGYMKIDDDTWMALNSGYTKKTGELQSLAENSPQKFAAQEYDDVDTSKWATRAAMINNSTEGAGFVESEMGWAPTGTKYTDAKGNVYVKREDGQWIYKEKDKDKGEVVKEGKAAENVMDAKHGKGNWVKTDEAIKCLETASEGSTINIAGKEWQKKDGNFVSAETGETATCDKLGTEAAYNTSTTDISGLKKLKNTSMNSSGDMEVVGKLGVGKAKKYLESNGQVLDGKTSLQKFSPEIEASWKTFDQKTKAALYDYTTGSSYVNEPLHGLDYKSYKGKDGVEDIGLITDAISKNTIHETTVMFHGVDINGFCKTFGISSYKGEETLNQIMGKTGKDTGFYSCGASVGSGFKHKDIIIDTVVPAGSKGIYVEQFSYYGNGSKSPKWNGKTSQSSVSEENEIILQRNGRYKATGWYKAAGGKIHVIAELVGQYPEEMGVDEYAKHCGS